MSSVPQDSRFAPPAAHVEDVAGASATLEHASRGARLGAMLIDHVMVLLGFAVIGMFVYPSVFDDAPSDLTPMIAAMLLQAAIALGLYLLLNGWLLATRGQTIGKVALRIRVVRPDGSEGGFLRLFFVRYAASQMLYMIPLVGGLYALADCLAIFRDSHRCLHDNLADTIVVKA
jgi:uncharacterized RDD family membrane protein YckC